MELPAALRQAVDSVLAPVPISRLSGAARTLSDRYRGEIRDGSLHISDDLAAQAYLATRLPATFAAVSSAFDAVAQARPDFAPRSMLDIGAGPGTATWAAAQMWPLSDALLLERSSAIRQVGEKLSAQVGIENVAWQDADLAKSLSQSGKHDLVAIAYVLNELSDDVRDRLIDDSWTLSSDTLVVIEPGTPGGWRRILRARERLLAHGANPVAPCPHALNCLGNWCHFSRKVARSRVHRLAKDADVPWEDEKFIYFAASRHAAVAIEGRVIAPPKTASGRVSLKLCCRDGAVRETLFSRREGAAYKIARRLDWGDALAATDQP